jgi:hypothetical protein
MVSMKITTRNKIFFGGRVIATVSVAIFSGHPKAPKVTLFLGNYF